MNICITGSNGMLGSVLTLICLSKGWNVESHKGHNTGDLLDEIHLKKFASSLPELDSLICCAGGKDEDTDFNSFQKMINKNLFATHLTCKHLIPKMKKNSTIITIGSVAGCFGQDQGIFYAASKAALHNYSRCLAKQLIEKKITVNCLALGTLTNSNLTNIAESITEFCKFSSINGQVIRIDNGHHTFAC